MSGHAAEQDRHCRRIALLAILGSAAYRLLFINWFDVTTDEAYYWMWSTRLDWGYVDHPPMIAYVLWLVGRLAGAAPWAWRVTAIVLSGGSCWLIYRAGTILFNARAGMWSAIALAFSPVISMVLGVILLPESLLVFWTALALLLAAKLVTTRNRSWFYALGAVFGLGMLSNPPALLIPTGLVLFGLLSPEHRHWFRSKEPYLGVLLGLAIMAPLIYWNYVHDWAGVAFLSERTRIGAANAPPGLELTWQSLVAQALYHSPLVFVLLWAGLFGAAVRALRARDPRFTLLLCFSLPLLLLFLLVATLRTTQGHWPTSAYLAAYLALPGLVFGEGFHWTRRRRALAAATLTVQAVLFAPLPILMVYPLTSVGLKYAARVVTVPPDAVEPVAQCAGWRDEIRDGLLEIRQRVTRQGQPPVLLTHFNVLAGLLSYYLHDVCEVVSVHAQARQYDIWYDDDRLRGRPVLFVSAELFDRAAAGNGRPEDYYDFETCIAQPVIEVRRHGFTINRVRSWLCTGYRGPMESASGG